jgi:hypothetical protein
VSKRRVNESVSFDPVPGNQDTLSQKLNGRVTRHEKRALLRVCLEESRSRGVDVRMAALIREILLADPRIQKHLKITP